MRITEHLPRMSFLFSLALVTVFTVTTLTRHNQAQESRPLAAAPADLSKSVIGTWKLEVASTPGSPSGVGTRLKLFTGTHWCVIQPDPNTGVIVFQHGGRYELNGETMKENRDFAGGSTKDMIGGTGSFKIQIDGDTLKQADSDGVFNETWKRVK